MILPSILIFAGVYGAKKRSDAFFSTINLKSGFTFISLCARLVDSESLGRILFHYFQALCLLIGD